MEGKEEETEKKDRGEDSRPGGGRRRYKGEEGTRGEGREERRAEKLSHLEGTFQKQH